MDNLKNLFVYGSLLEGFSNSILLTDSLLLGKAITLPKFTLVSLHSFPAVLLEGTTIITGELYQVDPYVYASIERLEGYPAFYDRTEIEVKLVGSLEKPILAELYFLGDKYKEYPEIASGSWEDECYLKS